MKKTTYTILFIALFTFTAQSNDVRINKQPTLEILAPSMSTTDIFNYLNTNLGLTSAQKPAVKTAVDEAGSEVTKLNASTTKSASEIATAKTSIVNGLIKKLSGGILSGTQSSKLSGLTSQLTSMFSQLK